MSPVRNLVRAFVAIGLAVLVSGCVIVPPGHFHHWHHHDYD